MRFELPNSRQDASYGDLISTELTSIVYKNFSAFARVRAGLPRLLTEFDRLIVQVETILDSAKQNVYADPSDVFVSICEFFSQPEQQAAYFTELPSELTSLAQMCNPACGYVSPIHLPAFREKLADLINKHLAAHATEEQQSAYFVAAISARKKRLIQPLPLVAPSSYPSAADLKLMEKYQISVTTKRPEFAMIVLIEETLQAIHDYTDSDDPSEDDLRKIKANILAINGALGLPYDPASNTSLAKESRRLDKIRMLLDESAFTIAELRNSFDVETREYLLHHAGEIMLAVNVSMADRDLLHKFIKAKQQLRALTVMQNAAANSDRALPLTFGRTLQNSLSLRINKDTPEMQALRYTVDTLENLILPYNLDADLSYYDPLTIFIAIKYREQFSRAVRVLAIPAEQLLALPERALFQFLTKMDDIVKDCSRANISLPEFFAQPTTHLAFLLTAPKNIARMHVLINYYFLPKTTFMQATLTEKQAWIDEPNTAIETFNANSRPISPQVFSASVNSVFEGAFDIIASIATTSSLAYLDDLINLPPQMVRELQANGLNFKQCQTIYNHLITMNNVYRKLFMQRFYMPITAVPPYNFILKKMRAVFLGAEYDIVRAACAAYDYKWYRLVTKTPDYSREIAQFFPQVFSLTTTIQGIPREEFTDQMCAFVQQLKAELAAIVANVQANGSGNRHYFLLHYLTHTDLDCDLERYLSALRSLLIEPLTEFTPPYYVDSDYVHIVTGLVNTIGSPTAKSRPL